VASPFAVFRRNQKIMLAVVGIGAMVAFVFLDPLMRYLGTSKGPDNPVVVETKYGAFKESEIQAMRQSRDLVNAFLQMTTSTTVQKLVENGTLDGRMSEMMAQNLYTRWRNEILERNKKGPEEAAIETLVLAKKAQQMGMVVSDQTINDMLKDLTADSIDANTLQAIIGGLQPGRRVSVGRLFEALRTEMLASKLSQLFAQSLADIPPAQKFDYYSRLNRRAKTEILPLAVVDFTSQVPNPPEDKLEKFFDEHKNALPDPASPTPGFKEPRRAAFQYFKADFAQFKEAAKPAITDAEIAEYYEKNKAQFLKVDLPSGPADETMPDEAKPEEGTPTDDAQPEAGDKPADSPAPEAVPDSPAPDAKPSDEKPAEGTPTPEENKQSSRIGGTFRLVSATADDPAPAADAPAAETPPTEAPAAEKPAEAATETPAAETPAAEAPAAAAPAAETPAEEQPKPTEYEPLEKVADQIRDTLAGQKAVKQIGEIFDDLSAKMKRHAEELDNYDTLKEKDKSAQPPKPFPFAELAKEKKIAASEMALCTAAEAAVEDLGKVHRFVPDRRSQFGFRSEPFTDFAFSDGLPVYRSQIVEDNDGNAYLFWKTEEKASYVPKFADAHDKALAAWKMIEARPLARKRAEELAAQAKAAGKPLAEVFKGDENIKPIEAGWFSWLTMGNVPQDPQSGRPRITPIDGVEYIGNAFMETVFGLEAGGLGVTANYPEDTAYVVRLAEFERPLEELRDDFAKERPAQYMAVAQPDQYRMFQSWLAGLEKDAKIHWVRRADSGRWRGPADEPIDESDL